MKIYILCLMIALILAKSPCEQTESPKGFQDCKGKDPEFPEETCCYVVSIHYIILYFFPKKILKILQKKRVFRGFGVYR